MGTLIHSGLLFGIGMFEVWLCYQMLFSIIIEKSALRTRDKWIIGINIIFLGHGLMFNRDYAFFSHAVFIYEVFVLCGFAWLIVRKFLGTIINWVLFYCNCVALVDFLFAFICIIFLRESFEYKIYINPNSLWQIAIYICTRGLIAGVIYEIKRKWIDQIEVQEYGRILFIVNIFLLIVLRQYQYNIVNMFHGDRILREKEFSISLLGTLSIIAIFLILFMKYKTEQKENEIIRLRENLLLQEYGELKKGIEQNRCQVHDIKHDIIALKNYAKEGDLVRLNNYLEKMEEGFFDSKDAMWLQNPLWNFMFSQKSAEAKQKEVEMQIHVSPNISFPFDDREGCILFGNLLDNAIEACEKVQEGEKRIRIKIEKQQNLVFMEVANSIYEKPKYGERGLITTKSQPSLHGYGLKSVRRIVEKYGGILSYHTLEKVFIMELTFFEIDIRKEIEQNGNR